MSNDASHDDRDANEELTRMIASNKDDCAGGIDHHRDPFLTERYITVKDAELLLNCSSREEAEEFVKASTKLIELDISSDDVDDENIHATSAATRASSGWPKRESQEGRRLACLLDFYLMFARFCQQENLTGEKASTLLSLMKEVYSQAILHRMDVSTAFSLFRRLLLKHSVQRPPFSIRVFTLEEVKKITEFAMNTFFTHYKLYVYMNIPHRHLVVHSSPAEDGETTMTHEKVLRQQECYDFTEGKPADTRLPDRVKDAIDL
ncbi:hypothetical protein FOZ61_006025 [Perkinsus olseni]|uniref:Uncharacterized protein n=1 Tax=Perkinsus olseni TaxID=32597 RepID=A0A7J6LRB2_PEROL|nr:hypothetical protein FOZ61_006025 [Perkinsus olseni]KAF4661744.1 hypothetical protein FOL46_005621 [Perkinsus olseni]